MKEEGMCDIRMAEVEQEKVGAKERCIVYSEEKRE